MQADGPGGRWGGEGSAGGRGPLKYALLRRSQGEYMFCSPSPSLLAITLLGGLPGRQGQGRRKEAPGREGFSLTNNFRVTFFISSVNFYRSCGFITAKQPGDEILSCEAASL